VILFARLSFQQSGHEVDQIAGLSAAVQLRLDEFVPYVYDHLVDDLDVYLLDYRGLGKGDHLVCATQQGWTSPGGYVVTDEVWPGCVAEVESQWGGNDLPPLVITRGPWYMVQLGQTYALLASATILLIWRLIQYRTIYRRQMVVILVALAIPWLVNALYQSGPDWLPPIDLTPISFTLSALLISVSVFRMELFDLVPIARHLVMDQIPELVLVVDANDRVLDANHMAGTWLQKPVDLATIQRIVQKGKAQD